MDEEFYDDGRQNLIGHVNVLMRDQDISPGASTTALGYEIMGDV